MKMKSLQRKEELKVKWVIHEDLDYACVTTDFKYTIQQHHGSTKDSN